MSFTIKNREIKATTCAVKLYLVEQAILRMIFILYLTVPLSTLYFDLITFEVDLLFAELL